jgi:hypothetical protein
MAGIGRASASVNGEEGESRWWSGSRGLFKLLATITATCGRWCVNYHGAMHMQLKGVLFLG